MKRNVHHDTGKIRTATHVMFILFILLTFLDMRVGLSSHDELLTLFVQKITPYSWDPYLSLFSLLGSFEFLTAFLLIIIIYFERMKIFETFFFYSVGLGIEIFGKNIIQHIGPPSIYSRYAINFHFPSSLYQTGFSYPSGHSFRTAFVTCIILCILFRMNSMTLRSKLAIGTFFTFVLSVMAYSRVSLGEHWSTDVLAGILLGFWAALMVFSYDYGITAYVYKIFNVLRMKST